MKKTFLTIAIVLGMAIGASAQNRGLFDMGPESPYFGTDENPRSTGLFLPTNHGEPTDIPGDGAPLGTGIAMLVSLGAAYAMTKRNKK